MVVARPEPTCVGSMPRIRRKSFSGLALIVIGFMLLIFAPIWVSYGAIWLLVIGLFLLGD